MQARQREWHEQWSMLSDDELWLFKDWIYPATLEDFRGKQVLECGCGGGQHTSFIAPLAGTVTAVDLNCADLARQRNRQFSNVEFIDDDIATMDLGRRFDIVFSVGVVHHTNDPDRTSANLKKHVKPGGRLILWVYSREGNFIAEHVVETIRRSLLARLPRKKLLALSRGVTASLYPIVYSIYSLPLKPLPYFEYFQNFKRLSFERNLLNVFDKLNAPQVQFLSRGRVEAWFNDREFSDIHLSAYRGVSWRASGTLKP